MEKIGIVTAMNEEYIEIKNIMNEIKEDEIGGLKFLTGRIQNTECVLVKSGVGKVHAARTTQILIDNFDVRYIINIGTAGSINDMLKIGDVLIGKHVVQHDFDITAFDHSKGYIPEVGDRVICDKALIDEFENIIVNSDERTYNIKAGIVATGDIFVTDVEMRNKIRAKFNADVVDMECGAIAQVAYLNNKPFIVIRVVSDTPNGKNSMTFDENLRFASKRSASILKEFLK